LDFIGVDFALGIDQTLLESYVNGTAGIDQVVAALMQGGL
jgi:hypothetical protein